MGKGRRVVIFLLLACILVSCGVAEPASSSSTSESSSGAKTENWKQDALDVYLYALPLVMNYAVRDYLTNTSEPTSDRSPMNSFIHYRAPLRTATWGLLQPNGDCLQSMAVLDLSEEPVVLNIPKGEQFTLAFYDSWGEQQAVLDTAGDYLLCAPEYDEIYHFSGARELFFEDPHLICVMQKLCQADSEESLSAVKKWQSALHLYPFSGSPSDQPVGEYDAEKRFEPKKRVLQMSISEYFQIFSDLLAGVEAHHMSADLQKKMNALGISAGAHFDLNALPLNKRLYLETLALSAFEQQETWEESHKSLPETWQLATRRNAVDEYACYVADLLQRSYQLDQNYMVTYELSVDSGGKLLNGENRYVVWIPKTILPEGTDWSIGIYNPSGNPIYGENGRCSFFQKELTCIEDSYYSFILSPDSEEGTFLKTQAGNFILRLQIYGEMAKNEILIFPKISEKPVPKTPDHQPKDPILPKGQKH